MCYSLQASIYAFSIGTLLSLGLFIAKTNTDSKIIGSFFLFVTLMQLFDAYFWITPNNAAVSKVASLFNHAQPLVLALLIFIYKDDLSKRSKVAVALYIIVISLYSISVWDKIGNTKPLQNGSLNWSWNHGPFAEIVYIVFLGTMVLLLYDNLSPKVGILSSVIAIVSFAASVAIYNGAKSVGRFWCWFACFIPLLFYFV